MLLERKTTNNIIKSLNTLGINNEYLNDIYNVYKKPECSANRHTYIHIYTHIYTHIYIVTSQTDHLHRSTTSITLFGSQTITHNDILTLKIDHLPKSTM